LNPAVISAIFKRTISAALLPSVQNKPRKLSIGALTYVQVPGHLFHSFSFFHLAKQEINRPIVPSMTCRCAHFQEPRPRSDWTELTIIFPELYVASNYYGLTHLGQAKTEVFNTLCEETASCLQTGIPKVHGFFSLTYEASQLGVRHFAECLRRLCSPQGLVPIALFFCEQQV
jgi:hypothetical protein